MQPRTMCNILLTSGRHGRAHGVIVVTMIGRPVTGARGDRNGWCAVWVTRTNLSMMSQVNHDPYIFEPSSFKEFSGPSDHAVKGQCHVSVPTACFTGCGPPETVLTSPDGRQGVTYSTQSARGSLELVQCV